MALPNRVVTNIGHVEDFVAQVADEVAWSWPIVFIWGAPGRGTGDHAAGLALDFMTLELGGGVSDPGPGRDWIGHQVAAHLLANRQRMSINYIIWDRRIASVLSEPDWAWRTYGGPNPHTDHVHVSFHEDGTYEPPPLGGGDGTAPPPIIPEEEDMPLSKTDLDSIENVVERLLTRKRGEYGYGSDLEVSIASAGAHRYSWGGLVSVNRLEPIIRSIATAVHADPVDEAAIAQQTAALLIPVILAELPEIPVEQLEAATERVMRRVLGGLDEQEKP